MCPYLTHLGAGGQLISPDQVRHSRHFVGKVDLDSGHHERDGVDHPHRELELLRVVEQPVCGREDQRDSLRGHMGR